VSIFFLVSDFGRQFGPFGSLIPMQLDNQIGRGLFTCDLVEEDTCQFCSNGITADENIVVSGDGETCGSVFESSKTLEKVSKICKYITNYYESTCCPEGTPSMSTSTSTSTSTSMNCPFCNNGFSFVNASLAVPGTKEYHPAGVDYTCEDMLFIAQNTSAHTDECKGLQQVKSLCCPEGQNTTDVDNIAETSDVTLVVEEDDEPKDKEDAL